MGCIQFKHKHFFPPQVFGWSWWGCRLGSQTCSLQLIYFLDLKYSSRSLFEPFFVGCWLVWIISSISALIYTKTFSPVCCKFFSGPYSNGTYGFTSLVGLWKVVERMTVLVVSPVVINILIGLKSVPQVHRCQHYVYQLKKKEDTTKYQ